MSEGAKLVVTPLKGEEYTVELTENFTIGRGRQNSLVIIDEEISRRHAEVRSSGGGRHWLFDAGSSNGSWVNGQRVAAPRELKHDDQISIGKVLLRFVAPEGLRSASTGEKQTSTKVAIRKETIVVMVSDVRGYSQMSQAMKPEDLSRLISEWFSESSEVIQQNGGTVDKFIGDAILSYWVISNRRYPKKLVGAALTAAQETLELSRQFAEKHSGEFADLEFRIGIGLNLGKAVLRNVGAGVTPSFTVVGEPVNLAFELEALTKEKGRPIVVSSDVANRAPEEFEFENLGGATLRGRDTPMHVLALKGRE